jgi:DNA repair protein RadC
LARKKANEEAIALPGEPLPRWECPRCGYEASNDQCLPPDFFRPWHLRGRDAVRTYVESLGTEADEWLLALFVDCDLNLLSVEIIAQGDISSCRVPFAHILCRGHALNAAGFILVHNHPSGDPTPSDCDIQTTRRLAHVSRELDMPLLVHLIVARDGMRTVGEW